MKSRNIAFVALTTSAVLALAGGVAAQVVVQPSQPPAVIVEPAPPPPVVVRPTPPPTVIVEQPQHSTTVVQPAPAAAPAAPGQQVVQAEDIEANEVRAHTIYANKIKATHVNGRINQTNKVEMSGKNDLKVPSLVASVIYAETIEARTVTAENIYVRELERR